MQRGIKTLTDYNQDKDLPATLNHFFARIKNNMAEHSQESGQAVGGCTLTLRCHQVRSMLIFLYNKLLFQPASKLSSSSRCPKSLQITSPNIYQLVTLTPVTTKCLKKIALIHMKSNSGCTSVCLSGRSDWSLVMKDQRIVGDVLLSLDAVYAHACSGGQDQHRKNPSRSLCMTYCHLGEGTAL